MALYKRVFPRWMQLWREGVDAKEKVRSGARIDAMEE